MTSALKEILTDEFLLFIAKKFGHRDQWSLFFTRLQFEDDDFDHWQDKSKDRDSLEPIMTGLKIWKKRSLQKVPDRNKSIEEIKDWLVLVLESKCERKDISDKIKTCYKEMDKIIELLSDKVTKPEQRLSLFVNLGIDSESIEAGLSTGTSLKERTRACLNSWFTQQCLNYWKYQELLMAFRDSERVSDVDSIVERFKIKELKNVRKYFETVEEETLTPGMDEDLQFNGNASFVGNSESSQKFSFTVNWSLTQTDKKQLVSEPSQGAIMEKPVCIPKVVSVAQFSRKKDSDQNQQMLFQQSLADTVLPRKSDDVIYLRNKRPKEETMGENDAYNKKLKTGRFEMITEDEMEIGDEDKVFSKDKDTNSCGDATVTYKFQQSSIQLRDYQQELAVLPLKGINTIICAGTNAGKTFVALHVIERHLEKNTTGKVVFMTRTNVLLGQQFDAACRVLPALSLTGKIRKWEAGQDFTIETFKNLVKRCSILFLTPKSLCNFLDDESDSSRVDIDQFTLLVLDECHHTYGKSPYNEIMGHYRKKKFENEQSSLPQILGLTASPGTNRAKDRFGAKDHLIRIMTNLDVNELSVVRKCESTLLEYSSKPTRVTILSKKREKDPVKDILIEAMNFVEDILDSKEVRNYLNKPANEAEGLFEALRNPPKDRTTERYILWLSETKKKIEGMLTNETQVLRLMHACFRHLEFYAGCLECNSLLDIIHIKDRLNDGTKRLNEESSKATNDKEKGLLENLEEVVNEIYDLGRRIEGNPDVEEIIKVLKEEHKKQGEKSRFLIFVKTRMTAKALAKKLPEEFNSRHLTGSQVSKEEGGLSKEEQMDIVNRFKEGIHLCLVATSVACEGLDIQQCTLMIRYRLNANEITSVQMRGRIRHKGGKEVIIASQEELEREEINVERLFLMEMAVEDVLTEDVRQKIATSEMNTYLMEEQERQRLKTNSNSEKKGKFYINCALCGKYIVDGQYIRRIKKTHSIVCDREIFRNIERRQIKKPQTFDAIKKTDKVFGFSCGHNWGSILIYQECEFVSLSQDYITIVNKETSEPTRFKKWSEVHMEFPLDDITDNELIEYRSKL